MTRQKDRRCARSLRALPTEFLMRSRMKLVATTLVGWLLLAAASAPQAQPPQPPTARVGDLKASDGTILKASYFATEKPFPCALLLHQGNRTRQSWDDLAGRLAAAGINTLTFDMRGFGESGGTPHDRLTPGQIARGREQPPGGL